MFQFVTGLVNQIPGSSRHRHLAAALVAWLRHNRSGVVETGPVRPIEKGGIVPAFQISQQDPRNEGYASSGTLTFTRRETTFSMILCPAS